MNVSLLPAFVHAQEGTATAPAPSSATKDGAKDPSDILGMDIEQLAQAPVKIASGGPSMDLPVTSVAKEQSTVGRSAAAIFVITNEMIRRSGATCIPEVLRMAPGMDVARVNSNTWAISCRGFNNTFANKLLVLIDGRTVYSPSFSGTYWDVQDYVMEDIDRIEVIRGPGGTLWGANAVNGVVNIITKNAKDTQGLYVTGGGGTVERSNEAVRYGGQIGEEGYYRVYGKYFDRGPFRALDDQGNLNTLANDAWTQGRFGFRSDWSFGKSTSDTLTIQGDHYLGNEGASAGSTSLTTPYVQTIYGENFVTGENILARWRHVNDDDSDWTLQSYFDNAERTPIINSTYIKTFDIDFQHRFQWTDRQQITWGVGYRYIHDDMPSKSPFTVGVIPTERSTFIASQFIQDEIKIVPDLLHFTAGCKLEQNSYTYFEYQPSVRLLYTPDAKHTAWGAISRAVHTPSRVDENLFATSAVFPDFFQWYIRTYGNPDLQSETLIAYELGYREQTTETFSWDFATFYNSYDKLRSLPFIGFQWWPYWMSSYQFGNGATAHSYGAELAVNWAVTERWTLSGQYTYLQLHIYGDTSIQGDGYSPRNQVYLQSAWNLTKEIDLDLTARYVDRLEGLGVPSYIEMDLRLAWRPREHIEIAVVGQNLLQAYHYEFGRTTETSRAIVSETPRGVYGTLTWRY